MQFEIGEILYYGGLGAVLLAVILGVILFMTFKYRKARLELKLMEEYGDSVPLSGGASDSKAARQRTGASDNKAARQHTGEKE